MNEPKGDEFIIVTSTAMEMPPSTSISKSNSIMAIAPLDFKENKMPYRTYSQHANRLTLSIPVLRGLLRVNRKTEKDA